MSDINQATNCFCFAFANTFIEGQLSCLFCLKHSTILTKSFVDMPGILCISIKQHILLIPFTRRTRTLCAHSTGHIIYYAVRHSLYLLFTLGLRFNTVLFVECRAAEYSDSKLQHSDLFICISCK